MNNFNDLMSKTVYEIQFIAIIIFCLFRFIVWGGVGEGKHGIWGQKIDGMQILRNIYICVKDKTQIK